jgi:aspartate aminotransferase
MMGFCTPTALMQLAIRKLLAHGPDLQRLSARRELLSSALRAYGYSVVPGQATFFLYVRSPDPDDFAFTERLASKGVFVLPSSLFHDSGYFRVSLTASDEMVERARPVFESAVHG